jgi:protein-L-isoaspartate(D-aspartate) O-methyltransferase
MIVPFRQAAPITVLLCCLLIFLQMPTALARDFDEMRAGMVREIHQSLFETRMHIGKRTFDERVTAVMGKVPRHEFVPESLKPRAYINRPLPIGFGQTISQPYIVALMTDMLELESGDTVLEVGTGSGYQAAVLAELVEQVYSIEIIEELSQQAGTRLRDLGYGNIETGLGDGYNGWPEHAPFDAIIVTAAASHVPPPLVRQLKPGGVMLIPVGSKFQVQQLTIVRKNMDGGITTRQFLPVRFVPLTGSH